MSNEDVSNENMNEAAMNPAGPNKAPTPGSDAIPGSDAEGQPEPANAGGFLQVLTTAGSREEADRIAAVLVGRRLAACVQVLGPLTSSYWWEGRVETAQEWLCLAKTTRARYEALEAAVRQAHSYDVPEILATPVAEGSEPYLRWLAGALSDPH